MEKERKVDIKSCNCGTKNAVHVPVNKQNHPFGASRQVKEENDESDLLLSQWLHPSKYPQSYLALLNEESTLSEKAPLDCVVEQLVLPSRDTKNHAGGGIRTIYSASVNDSDKIGSSKVKPSVRVPNNDPSLLCQESSWSKAPVTGRSSDRSTHPLSQNYSEKLRNWKEQSNKSKTRGFSQLYGRYRDVPSKHSTTIKPKSYTTERERKQRIDENIKALREFLPHEIEDTPESILNGIVAHVKLLQLQMKELSRSRLGGEQVYHPLISIEGYGHFIHQEQEQEQEQTITKPLEEIMADFLANDPDAATTFLEEKGLYLMPFSSVEGFG